MHQTDLEDLIDEYNAVHGLPPAKRNNPRPTPVRLCLSAVARRPRRHRAPRVVQTTLEDLIDADNGSRSDEDCRP
jgi:hypothetical protein